MKRKGADLPVRRGGQPKIRKWRREAIQKRLRQLRKDHTEKGTDEGFALVLGVPRQTVSSWFGTKTPGTAHILAISDKLDVQPTWLLLGEGPEYLGATLPVRDMASQLHGYVLGILAKEARANPDFLREAVLPTPIEMLGGVLEGYRAVVRQAVNTARSLRRAAARDGLGADESVLGRALQLVMAQDIAKSSGLPPVDLPGTEVDLEPERWPIPPLTVGPRAAP